MTINDIDNSLVELKLCISTLDADKQIKGIVKCGDTTNIIIGNHRGIILYQARKNEFTRKEMTPAEINALLEAYNAFMKC